MGRAGTAPLEVAVVSWGPVLRYIYTGVCPVCDFKWEDYFYVREYNGARIEPPATKLVSCTNNHSAELIVLTRPREVQSRS